MKLPPWPYFDEDEIKIVSDILRSGKVNYWTGSEGSLFENDFSSWCGTNHSIAMANGSLALYSIYKAIGLGPGDELITTPRTFIATSSCALLLGADVVFADVDENSGCITSETIIPLITSRTKAISVVHLAGWPANILPIQKLAKEFGLYLIEDCAQAHGATIEVDGEKKSVGSFGDASAWSFCQDKILSTAGEGGMVATNNKELFDYLWSLKDHGKTIDSVFNTNHPSGFRWLHEKIGSNFRLTELQSAIGRIQLSKLPEWTKLRTRNANILVETLRDLNAIRVPLPIEGFNHAWYKFYCFIDPLSFTDGWNRDRIVAEINNEGFPAYHGGCSEIYLEKCFKNKLNDKFQRLSVARKLGETSLMFLLHPSINMHQMIEYSEYIHYVFKKAIK